MSTKYLGETFDIHTGGEDHINVHHTNEIAQAWGAFGHNTARVWMHNAFITFGRSKISKSSGGLYTVKDLMEMGFDPMAYRYLVLGSHYRKGMEFSLENLKAAETALNKLRSYKVSSFDKINQTFKQEFIEAVSNDLAMPEALAVVWKLMKSDIDSQEKWATLLDFDRVLGLNLDKEIIEEEIPGEVNKLIEERQEARKNKNWAESDRLRDLIKEKGYMVEDLEKSCKIIKIK
jgi:cysteinyl-tRNA synthetase